MLTRILGPERRTTFAATFDQGVVSLGSFLTNLILARHLPTQNYGTYAVLYGILLVANAVHMALLALPMCIKSAASPPDTRRYAHAAAVFTALLAPVYGVVLVVVAWRMGNVVTGLAAALALLAWQLQETFRRSLTAHLRYTACVWGDALLYLGQAAAVFALLRTDRLSLTAVFLTLAASATAGALLQAAQVGIASLGTQHLRDYAAQFWDLGRWMLSGTTALMIGTQMFPWVLAYALGVSEAARFQAMATVLGVVNPLMFSLPNVITAAVAGVRAQGRAAVHRVARHYAVQFIALGAPYLLLLALAPTFVLARFYGSASPYVQLATPVRIFAIAYAIQFCWMSIGGMLNGLEKTRATSNAQLAGLLVVAAIGVPLSVTMGVKGAAIGLVAAACVRLVAMVRAARHSDPPPPTKPLDVTDAIALDEAAVSSSVRQ